MIFSENQLTESRAVYKILSLVVFAGLKSEEAYIRTDWIHVFSLPHARLQLQFTGKMGITS